MSHRITVLIVFALVVFTLSATDAAYISVQEDSSHIKVLTNNLITWIPKTNTAITVTNRVRMVQFQEKRPFDFRVNGIYYSITSLDSYSISEDRVTVNCSTNESTRKVKIILDYLSPTSFHISYEPSSGSAIEKCRSSLGAASNEHFYGLGEPRTGTLDLKGKQVRIWVDKGHPEQTNMVSFFMSSKGYGVWVDSYADGTFDIASSEPSSCKIIWPGNKLGYYFFYGPEFLRIIDQYTAITGRPPMPPKWQFGLAKWLRPQGANANVILQDIQQMENNGIPLSYTWIEPQWETQLNSLIFRTDIFPDPAGFIANLHSRGYKVGAWLRTDIFEDSPNYAEALALKHFVMNSSGGQWVASSKDYDYYADTYVYRNRGFVDFTDTDTVPWWNAQLQGALDYGFDGFKLDRGYEIDGTCQLQDGVSGAAAHNKYGYYTAKAHYEYLSSRMGNDFFIMHKTESAGAQSYVTIHWSGDQEGNFTAAGLPSGVIGVQSCALSGFPFWTSDIGGWYTENPSKEVFIRWTQFSAFTPAMETLFGPWQFDSETTEIFRFYTKLHYELIPYIYSLAYQSHTTGEPIVRPLVYHYRTDQTAATRDMQFLLGRHLMVAPVCQEGASEITVYLPKGRWLNYWYDDEVIEGPATITVPTPIDSIPLFILSGAIFPLEITDSGTGHGSSAYSGAITLDCYPYNDSSFTIYQDGLAQEIRSSFSYPYLRIDVPSFSKRVIIRSKTPTSRPLQVKLNGSTITRYSSQSTFDSAQNGWYWTPDGALLVKYPANTQAVVEAGW